MVPKWVYAMVIGVLCAALGVGCGGGDDGATTTVSKAEFEKTVNAICKKTQEDRFDEIGEYDDELVANGEKPESPQGLESKFDDVLLPSMNKQLEELEEVSAPKKSQASYEALIEELAAGIEKLEEERVDGLSKAKRLLAFQGEAAELGLTCAA